MILQTKSGEIKYHSPECGTGMERYQMEFPSFSKGNVIFIVAVVEADRERAGLNESSQFSLFKYTFIILFVMWTHVVTGENLTSWPPVLPYFFLGSKILCSAA